MVRMSLKPCLFSASQVCCTCSMQGLKEQKVPSGRTQRAAEGTTCRWMKN
jgi:hypothetical protein